MQLWYVLQLTPMYVKYTRTAHTAVSLMIDTRGSKHVGDNGSLKKYILTYKIVHFFAMYCIIKI